MISEKIIVGYVRSLHGSLNDCDMQEKLIKRYSQLMSFDLLKMFIDMGFVKRRAEEDVEREKKLGVEYPRHIRRYPAWEEMLIKAMNDEISIIIVDRKERLYRNLNDLNLLETIVRQHGIQILEVENLDWPDEAQMSNVAAYHYFVPNTRRKGIRTANLMNDICDFYEEIAAHAAWRLCGLYIDSSAFKKTELPKLLARDDIDVIICKYFYHINRKVLFFLQMVQEFNLRGISLLSTEEGLLRYDPTGGELITESLRVAIYDCSRSELERMTREITRKRMELFLRTVAVGWVETAIYAEETALPGVAFDLLAENAKNYDVVVIDTFAKLGATVNELMDCMQRVKKPFYSLKEGLLYVDGKQGYLQSDSIQQGINR